MATSEARKRATEAYRRRQLAAGRLRLSGALIPDDVAETLRQMVARGEAETPTGAIWAAVRAHARRRRRD